MNFEGEVLQRLTAIETRLGENGHGKRLHDLEAWTKANPDVPGRLTRVEEYVADHPVECPLKNRRMDIKFLIGIIVGTAGLVKGLDVLIGWLT